MTDDTKNAKTREAPRGSWADVEERIRDRVRTVIERVLEEELEAALGAAPSARVGATRRGYRHGSRPRTVTTSVGPTALRVPRARLGPACGEREWHSQILRRYQRRTERVDEAILGVYLAGGNSRRVRGALAPLLRGGPLSKDAVSRLVGRLAEDFRTWQTRDLSGDQIQMVFLDGWYPKVRIGTRRVRVPVLVALGVRPDGQRVMLDLRLAGDESRAAWRGLLDSLVARQLSRPVLAVIDGNRGLRAALEEVWPSLWVQRCTAHKLRNLLAQAPKRFHEEISEDYRRVIYAETATAVGARRRTFTNKWQRRCPTVAASFEEAGDELFTFLRFAPVMWKPLRTTNALERINEEFRRRTKTQASLPSQDAVLLLLFGLLRTGHIRLRTINGFRHLPRPIPVAA